MEKRRNLFFYKSYFEKFFESQNQKVQGKILWTLRVICELEKIPELYIKHLTNTSGIYEIRVQVGKSIFRIFCFFDKGNIIVVGNGFQKKTQKTPKAEIVKAERIKREYYGKE
jgi:phage-related protein